MNPNDLGQRMVLPHLSGVKILYLIGYWIPVVLVLIPVLVVVPETPGKSSQLAVAVSEGISQGCSLVSGTPRAGTIPGRPWLDKTHLRYLNKHSLRSKPLIVLLLSS